MAITNYSELRTAIQNWAKRSDILTVMDDFIDLAEADMWTELRIRDMEARATATSSTTRFLALPDSFIEMRKLRVISGSISYELLQVPPESLTVQSTAGIPKQFTVTSQLEFDRPTAGGYTMEMNYYKSLTPLSSANTSNAVLTRFPMIYLYGSLYHYAQWAHNDVMLQKYDALFASVIKRANQKDRRGRHGPAPAMRTEASTP